MFGVRAVSGRRCSRRTRIIATSGAIGLLIVGGCAAAWLNGGLKRARELATGNELRAARTALRQYRWLHPGDPRARLLMAQLLVADDGLKTQPAADEALSYLRPIPDSSRFAADARTQEGRILLFLKRQPRRAEEQFRAAIALDRNLAEPYYLLWKLYDLTGRSHLAEDLVWQVIELSPESERAMRLREWYMSQFYPGSANPTLDELMGVVDAKHPPSPATEQRRFLLFRESEPDSAIGHAALARWFNLEGQPKYGLEMLQFGEPSLAASERDDPFLLATYLSSYFDLGRYEELEAMFARWPEPHEGYEYWRWKGIIEDDLRENYAAAIEAYDRALSGWPGPADWRTMTRKANCLTRLGRVEEAERTRTEAQRVENMMKDEVHERLRAALAQLNDQQALLQIAEFYRDLGRPREAASWLQLALGVQPRS